MLMFNGVTACSNSWIRALMTGKSQFIILSFSERNFNEGKAALSARRRRLFSKTEGLTQKSLKAMANRPACLIGFRFAKVPGAVLGYKQIYILWKETIFILLIDGEKAWLINTMQKLMFSCLLY